MEELRVETLPELIISFDLSDLRSSYTNLNGLMNMRNIIKYDNYCILIRRIWSQMDQNRLKNLNAALLRVHGFVHVDTDKIIDRLLFKSKRT